MIKLTEKDMERLQDESCNILIPETMRSLLVGFPDEVVFPFSINAMNCVNIKSISARNRICGSLTLRGCTSLATLGDGLFVGESLDVTGCVALTSIPNSLWEIKRDLLLSGCLSMRDLPEGLKVKSNFYANDCPQLEVLPKGLEVGLLMTIRNCERIAAIPDHVRVGRDLIADRCPNLKSISGDLIVGGKASFKSCHSLQDIPAIINVKSLCLDDCTNIRVLPAGLNIPDNLSLRDTKFQDFPRNLTVGGLIDISGCQWVTSFPDDFNFTGRILIAENCQNLIELPKSMPNLMNMALDGCTSLTHLPEGLNVYMLSLKGCTGLKALPRDLRVSRSVDLRGCEGISIPQEFIDANEGYARILFPKTYDILPAVKAENAPTL